MNKKFLIIFIIIIVAIIAAGSGFYFISKGKKTGEEASITTPSPAPVNSPNVNDTIGDATENPLENMPAVNPLENVANPFRAYKNPFK